MSLQSTCIHTYIQLYVLPQVKKWQLKAECGPANYTINLQKIKEKFQKKTTKYYH